jgi:adenine C2-methylase RlmN of 23S rRNA A2503 and tRNA A37
VRAKQVAAAKELDGVAARLAHQLKGKVSSRRTLEVNGLDARGYAIDHNGLIEEFTFVLRGRQEYELVCRRTRGADDTACRELVTSFHVA